MHSKQLCKEHIAVNRLMLSNCSIKSSLLTLLTGRVARSINKWSKRACTLLIVVPLSVYVFCCLAQISCFSCCVVVAHVGAAFLLLLCHRRRGEELPWRHAYFFFFFAIFSRAQSIPSGLPRVSCPALLLLLLQLHFASCCRVVFACCYF